MSAVLNSRPATGSCKEVPPVKQIQEGIQKDRVWIHVAYCGICMYHSARKCDVADKFERFNLHGIEKLLKNEKGFEGESMVNLYKNFPLILTTSSPILLGVGTSCRRSQFELALLALLAVSHRILYQSLPLSYSLHLHCCAMLCSCAQLFFSETWEIGVSQHPSHRQHHRHRVALVDHGRYVQ